MLFAGPASLLRLTAVQVFPQGLGKTVQPDFLTRRVGFVCASFHHYRLVF
ncbi:MAG: hypothetical protein OXC93_01375 [Rhodospirillaceae bacterium]|nr:hypothetical protein [Rhodospirillaceae bacterium]